MMAAFGKFRFKIRTYFGFLGLGLGLFLSFQIEAKEQNCARALGRSRFLSLVGESRAGMSDSDKEKELWVRYSAGDRRAGNILASRYFFLVRLQAQAVYFSDSEAILFAALEGYARAFVGFDHERGINFSTYATPLIRGAIQDYLRQSNWTARIDVQRSGYREKAKDRFYVEHGRLPDEEEIKAEVEKILFDESQRLIRKRKKTGGPKLPSPEQVLAVREKSQIANSQTQSGDGRQSSELERAVGRPLEQGLSLERRSLIQKLSRPFSRVDQLILRLYFFEDMTMKEIGTVIGVSESRVSQRLVFIKKLWAARFRDSESGQNLLQDLLGSLSR